jgi:hypothetical protein
MRRPSSISNRAIMILVTALCTGAATTLVAQQPSGVARNAAQASSPSTVLSGPRLQPEWPRFEPRIAENNALNSASLSSNHTFVFSTLALVIIGVLVLVLIL